jgi:molybdate transport system permease protein
MNSTTDKNLQETSTKGYRVRSDIPFFAAFGVIGAIYVIGICAMIAAGVIKIEWQDFATALADENIQYSIRLSMISCTITALLSVIVSVPIGYLLSRYQIPGKIVIDALLDIPIVLPPLVIGLSLLILFGLPLGGDEIDPFTIDDMFRYLSDKLLGRDAGIVFQVPAVIIAQFMVACAFAVRTMRATFDQIPRRHKDVALTLGCSHGQAFWRVVLPHSYRGIMTAFTLSWARALGEFGPILVFAGSVRMRTEVLPVSVFLELGIGNVKGALAISLIMVATAVVVLILVRLFGGKTFESRRGLA